MSGANSTQWILERSTVLSTSTEPAELTVAAAELAGSDDPGALDALGQFLHDPGFLGRLDDPEDPGARTRNLGPVLKALAERPSPEIVPLCLGLIQDPVFIEESDRKIFLLEALAAVVPMSAGTVEAFRNANEEGYYASSARLLAGNSSPLALGLYLEMMLDNEIEAAERVDILHMSLIPVRNRIAIMECVAKLVAKNPGEEVANAAIESIYNYESFWRKGHPAPPPAWRTSSSEVLRYLVSLAPYLKKNCNMPEGLREAMDRTTAIADALLSRRTA